jgi:uncharacterized phage protein gp47/JayE
MSVTKTTPQQYAAAITNGITSLNKSYDTQMGPIPDIVINPVSTVLSAQNSDILQLQSLLALVQNGSYTYADLVGFVANEGIYPNSGAQATVNLVFSTATVLSTLTVASGFPVSTQVDEISNQSVTFVTMEQASLPYATRSSYYNAVTQRYELSIPAIATTGGESGNVAANRITRPLRPLVGFSSVFNRDAAQGGMNATTSQELIERYLIAIVGSAQSVASGTRSVALDLFPNVRDVAIVYGYNPLLTRAAYDAGAVDEWIMGTSNSTRQDVRTFTGRGIPIVLINQPVQSVTSVVNGATVYTEGVDWTFVKDTSGNSGSVRGYDSVVFTFGGAAPVAGASLIISYIQNSLVEYIQTTYDSPSNYVFGRDLLIRQGVAVPVQIYAELQVGFGLAYNTVLAQVQTAILGFVDSLLLNARIPGVSAGGSLQMSDVNAVVRRLSGVDNFIMTTFSVVGGTGAADIPIGFNQYPTLDAVNLIIVAI